MQDVLTTHLAAPASWEQIRTEFRSRHFVALRQLAITIPDVDVNGLDRLLDPHRDTSPTAAEMAAALDRAFTAAAATPGALPVVAALVYGFCLKRWEHSTDHAAVATMATAGRAACAALPNPAAGNGTGSDRLAALVLLDLAASLISCMAVENALNCSCPIDMQRHARDAVVAADQVLADLPADPAADSAITGFIRQAAQAQTRYFGALLRVAQAVELFLTDPGISVMRLTAAIDAVQAAESQPALRDDVYESELRAHRMTLAAMVQKSTAPVLHINEGRIAYCYPFAVMGVAQSEDVVRCVEALRRGDMLGGARVADVGRLDVTETWEANDPEGRAYTGAMATLDNLLIVTTAGRQLPAHHVELRVSTMGICYLRIWTWLADLSAHELNQAMRRGSVQMGAETVRQDGPVAGEWSRLAVYAEQVVAGFERHLTEILGLQEESRERRLHVLFSVGRRHHTVLSLCAFSRVNMAGGTQRLYSYADLRNTVGATLLVQRGNYAAATLEEYVRIPDGVPRALVGDIGFEGEALARNADSTVVVMPTSPNFLVIGHEEMAEFSAALPALLDKWIALIYQQRRSLAAHLQSTEDLWRRARFDPRISKQFSRQVRDLERRQARLRDAVGEARSMLAFLKSPTLCRTSKCRDVLDMLFDAAGVERLEADLEAQTTKVDALYLQVQARATQLEERQTQGYRSTVEVALAFLAVTSLAEFVGLVNDAFVKPTLFWEVGAILAFAAIVVGVAVRSNVRNSDERNRTQRHPSRS